MLSSKDSRPVRCERELIEKLVRIEGRTVTARPCQLALTDLRIRTKDRRTIPFVPNPVQAAYLQELWIGYPEVAAGSELTGVGCLANGQPLMTSSFLRGKRE